MSPKLNSRTNWLHMTVNAYQVLQLNHFLQGYTYIYMMPHFISFTCTTSTIHIFLDPKHRIKACQYQWILNLRILTLGHFE